MSPLWIKTSVSGPRCPRGGGLLAAVRGRQLCAAPCQLVGTQLLAATQYRLGELAGTGRLDPDESMQLQENLFHIWEALYAGTLCAVRDEDTVDSNWDEADNTYSDGRQVMVQVRIEPEETSELNWEHNRFMLGDGAINEHPRGTICCISPVNLDDAACYVWFHLELKVQELTSSSSRSNSAPAQRSPISESACTAPLPARRSCGDRRGWWFAARLRRVPAHPIRLLDKAVNVQESKSCRIETLAQSRSHFLYQLVSQFVILFAFCAQALAIQRDRSGHLHRARSNRQR